MRSSRDDRRLFRGPERMRFATMVMMLVLLLVMIPTIRNRPGMFSWLTGDTDPNSPAAVPPAKGAGATDDPDAIEGKTEGRAASQTPAKSTATIAAKSESPKSDPPTSGAAKSEPAKSSPAKSLPAKTEPAKTEPAKTEPAKSEPAKADSSSGEPKTNAAPAAKSASPAAPPKSLADVPPGPDGLAPVESEEFQRERLKELLSVVTDKQLQMQAREMPAYYQLLKMAKNQKPEDLLKKAQGNLRFNDYFLSAPEHRGELVRLDLNVRRIESHPVPVEGQNASGVKVLYEVWGWSDEAKAWLYWAVVPELPQGMPTGLEVEERATFVGYFFKLQAYHDGHAKVNGKPLLAPLLIGRIIWQPTPKAAAQDPPWLWAVLGGFGVVIALVFAWSVLRSRKHRRSAKPATARADIADWFEPAGGPDGGASSSIGSFPLDRPPEGSGK